MNITPFSKDSVAQWREDMNVDVLREHGRVVGIQNYDANIVPYDVGGVNGIINVVPEFTLLADTYQDILHRNFNYRYFAPLCESLIGNGHVPHESLFGLPYDPRLLLDTNYRLGYFQKIRETIEQATTKSGKRAVIITHSLGGVLLKWFLTEHVTSSWIEKYIWKLYILNAPFGGTSMALRVVLSGEYYVPMFQQQFKDPLQKMTGILMCLPNTYAYDSTEPLVYVDDYKKTFSVKDFYHDKHIAFEIWRELYEPYIDVIMKPLHLNIHCDIVVSRDNETIRYFKMKKEGELPYECKNELGDGQVPKRSLELAKKLFYGNHVHYKELKGTGHIDIISNPSFISWVHDTSYYT